MAAAVGMIIVGFRRDIPPYEYWREATVNGAVYLAMASVLGRRRPESRISWILLAITAFGSVQLLGGEYAYFSTRGGLYPHLLASTSGWISELCQSTFIVFVALLLLVFPTGSSPGRRWKVVAWALVAGGALNIVHRVLSTESVAGIATLPSPFSLGVSGRVSNLVGVAAAFLVTAGALGAVVSLVVRFRRSTGIERQQLKWLVYAATIGPVVLIAPIPGREGELGTWLWALVPVSFIVSIGIAVLRYRLYDIDVLINRTLVYGALTAILAGTYIGLVTLASTFAGDSPVAVAAATLAVAALFQPLRRRVQDFIDHRFYRRKYDAEKTLESFSARLRDEIDLDTLSDELLAVVHDTMQPERASLWLRGPDPGAPKSVATSL
ncbi:MAG: hypothetical protein ABR575_07685 [Actinomycetota bacterium]